MLRVEVRGDGERYRVVVDGHALEVDLRPTGPHFLSLLIEGRSYEVGLEKRPGGFEVTFADDALFVELSQATRLGSLAPRKTAAGPARVTAPMPGRLLRVLVEPGQQVAAGEGLVVVEAMKMENELPAPRAGRIARLAAQEGQTVEMGALLVVLE